MNTPCPLIAGDWKPLAESESKRFIDRLTQVLSEANGADSAFTRQSPVTGLRALPLSFYPGWVLVEGEAQLTGGWVGTFDVLYGPGFMYLIDGSSSVIHSLNQGRMPRRRLDDDDDDAVDTAKSTGIDSGSRGVPGFMKSPLAPLEPTTTAPDYLRFFCAAVWGESGPFQLVESADAPAMADASAVDGWQDKARPLRLEAVDKGIEGQVLVRYGSGLFEARFRVMPDGMVTMLDDDVLREDLPTSRHESPFRFIHEQPAEPGSADPVAGTR
ncbi:MAG: hypothetical protein KKC85_20290 [Gammaproteobacteria bacterium]|nr:hypothetical protein [Gammaproteobacteria bacterium]MBU1444291.1 hypothetical protein [Gammaproteobacteria bacterium]MBU2288749.1 hypothetical protein [Gammaproteobacteria bacterium]